PRPPTSPPFPYTTLFRSHGEWLLNGVAQEQMLEIPLVTFGTALLLFSSFFVVLALNGAQKGNRKQLIGWLLATIVCGVFFVGMQDRKSTRLNSSHVKISY